MAGGKKAADPAKATLADSLAETPLEADRAYTGHDNACDILQALALKADALSTSLDEQQREQGATRHSLGRQRSRRGREGGKEPEHDARTAVATGRVRRYSRVHIDPRDWEDLLPRAYQDCPLPSTLGATRPSLWRLPNDEANRYLTEANKTASRDEYRHMLCYCIYRTAIYAAAKTALASAPDTSIQDRVDTLDLLDAACRTLEAVGDAREARLTYLRRFKAKQALTPEEQVAERLIHSRVFDTAEHERSANVVDGLLASLVDKRLEVGLAVTAKAQAFATFQKHATERDTDLDKAPKEKDKVARDERREQQRREADAKNRDKNVGKTGDKTRDRRFNQGASFNDATPAHLMFLSAELSRVTAACAWEKSSDCVFSFDLQGGVYALGIAPSDRDYFTVNIRRTLKRLCGLPMGWSLSPYYFTTFTMTFVKHLRSPSIPVAPGNVPRLRRWLRRGRWRGARILPYIYVDDFLLFASSEPEALELCQRVADLLDSMGMHRNAAKGLWEPVQEGQHLGVDIDTTTGYSYAPADKLQRLARQAKQVLQRAARDARWLPVRELHSLAGRAQYMYLAIPAARFYYLRELHHVVGPKWGGRKLEAMWDAHSVDRFASAPNAMLPPYNAAWLDPGCEAVDSMHLSHA
eukprot:jgi/Tetstr1/421670/TSEL_012609.t1